MWCFDVITIELVLFCCRLLLSTSNSEYSFLMKKDEKSISETEVSSSFVPVLTSAMGTCLFDLGDTRTSLSEIDEKCK